MFDIYSRLYVDKFLIRIGRDLLYKCNEVMEKVVDNKELMECMREDSVIYVQIKLL